MRSHEPTNIVRKVDIKVMQHPIARSFISQRIRLNYVDWGNEGAPILILLHGGRDHCRAWDWTAERLRHRYHVIAPDLRGHGDSEWSSDGNYSLAAYLYDLAQLIHQRSMAPARIVAHSLGGNIALRYAGTYPENVSRLVVIEGLALPPYVTARSWDLSRRYRAWIEERRDMSGRTARRYASIDEALARMMAENSSLSAAQARHLTIHGVKQNEDGSFSWKFDNYVRSFAPIDATDADLAALWERIACPSLLIHGAESWAPDPSADGTLDAFGRVRLEIVEGAGHWVHHDRPDVFLDLVESFLHA